MAAEPTGVDDGNRLDARPAAAERVREAADLAAGLDAAEDNLELGCDAAEAYAAAVKIEAAAAERGEVELVMRARLLQADMSERMGQTASVAQALWEVNRWATDHDCPSLLARSHLLLARTYHNLGDMAFCLDHAVSAVETLEPGAPSHTRTYHLMKLADALKWNGSMDAARERYRQAERIAAAGGPVELLMMVLNNLAYGEYMAGEPLRSWAAIERMLAVAATHNVLLSPTKIDTIARTQIALGRYAEAEQTIQTGIRDYEARGHVKTTSRAEHLLTLAVSQRHLGAIERAQATLDACRAACHAGGHAGIELRVQQEQAELFAAAGDFRAAYEAHKAFHAASERLRSLQREAHARTRQAMFETTEARRDAELFREQARRDPLTGLHNRRYADEHLPGLIADAAATGAPLAIGMIDVDHFKRINDTHSHHVGDRVLITVANLLFTGLSAVARTGFVARVGGEEFLIVLPGTALDEAIRHLDRVRTTVSSHPWRPLTGELPVTISIGVASTETTAGSATTLLADADRNLYAAKRAGRDRVAVAP